MTTNFSIMIRFRNFFYFCATCGLLGGLVGCIIGASENNIGILVSSLFVFLSALFLIFFIKKKVKIHRLAKNQNPT